MQLLPTEDGTLLVDLKAFKLKRTLHHLDMANKEQGMLIRQSG